jgi:hypothetical protein
MAKENHIDTICVLRECHDICLEAFSLHCMKMGGQHMASEHIRRMESCIELCNLTANFLLRHFPLTQELCDLTADICKQCAASCNGIDDTRMNVCARACEDAARACFNESHHIRAMAAA